MQDFHKTLGVSKSASKEEIKKAYRKLAMELHPDKNKSTDAHDHFLEITIAYDVLINGKIVRNKSTVKASANRKTPDHFFSKDPEIKYKNVHHPPLDADEFKEWYQVKKKQARRQAQMEFEEFKKNNDAFRKSKYFNLAKAFSYLIFLAGCCVASGFIAIPFVFGSQYHSLGVTMFLCLIFVPLGIWVFSYTLEYKKDFDRYFLN